MIKVEIHVRNILELLGLYPKLLLFAPQAVLLHIIVDAYYKRHHISLSLKAASNVINVSLPPTEFAEKTIHVSPTTSTPLPNTTASRKSAFSLNLAAALLSAPDESSPEYMRNMQNLQNMMGEISDIYDTIAGYAHYFDWSSEADTIRVLQLVLLSTVGVSLVAWFVPLNIIFLVAGVSVFLVNTRFAKHLIKQLLPLTVEYGQTKMEMAAQWYAQLEKQVDEQGRIREISLFENQRWSSASQVG